MSLAAFYQIGQNIEGCCPRTVPITDIAALGKWAHLVLLEESPLNVIIASVHDRQRQQHRAASPCQSSPRHLIHACFLGCARGG